MKDQNNDGFITRYLCCCCGSQPKTTRRKVNRNDSITESTAINEPQRYQENGNGDLSQTAYLDYTSQMLRDIPPEVCQYSSTLQELNLSFNKLTTLPRNLFSCTELRHLNLADNELTQIPATIESLKQLQSLDASKNDLNFIHENLRHCVQLRILELSGNCFEQFPTGLSSTRSLQELYLNYSFIESFVPDAFTQLSRLKILELRNNNLVMLPRSLNRLEQLERLDIGMNAFESLPDIIGNLKNLRELLIDDNHIELIPTAIGQLKHLEYFDASTNQLVAIPTQIGSCQQLTELNLTNNHLSALPHEIGSCKNLTSLKLDQNQLITLPDSVGSLHKLEELSLTDNCLSYLPDSISGLANNLLYLICDRNQLVSLPESICQLYTLRVLSVANNRLERLPETIGNMVALSCLNITNNRLHRLPISLLQLQELNAIWLSETQTKSYVHFDEMRDFVTGINYLTCVMLPQKCLNADYIQQIDEPTPINVDSRRIYFEMDLEEEEKNNLPPETKLMRSPTPYAKELHKMAEQRARRMEQEALNAAAPNAGTPVNGMSAPTPPPYHIAKAYTKKNASDLEAYDSFRQSQRPWMFGVHRNPKVLQVLGLIAQNIELIELPNQGIFVGNLNEVTEPPQGDTILLQKNDKILDLDGVDFTKITLAAAKQVIQSIQSPSFYLMISR